MNYTFIFLHGNYILNPFLGLLSSFWVRLTPNFSLSFRNFILNHAMKCIK
ncbi:unknown [Paraprevotella clara CAG:116]|nr:unknown [Paraprevotella clara CAG:116]